MRKGEHPIAPPPLHGVGGGWWGDIVLPWFSFIGSQSLTVPQRVCTESWWRKEAEMGAACCDIKYLQGVGLKRRQ